MQKTEVYRKETSIRHCYKIKKANQRIRRSLIRFFYLGGMFVHTLAENNGGDGADRGRNDGRTDNGGWPDTAVLLSVGDDVHRNQLKRGNVDNEKITHFVAGDPGK